MQVFFAGLQLKYNSSIIEEICLIQEEIIDEWNFITESAVGPGDPELMTLKAVRLIHENEIIAVPRRRPERDGSLPDRGAGRP